MNAYELADGMETLAQVNANIDEQIRGCMMDSATMLRQQADRIAELDKQVGIFDAELMKVRICNSLMKTDRDRLADRIAELEKDLDGCEYFLKAHPHKELSDEEICGIAGKLSIATTEIENDWAFCVVEFARAIIKASRGEE